MLRRCIVNPLFKTRIQHDLSIYCSKIKVNFELELNGKEGKYFRD